MKRILIALLIAGITLSPLSLAPIYSAEDPPVETAEPTPAPEDETAPEEPAPPVTEEPPETAPPDTTPPADWAPTVDSVTALLIAAAEAGHDLITFSTVELLADDFMQTVCNRVLGETPQIFYLRAIDVGVLTLPAPDEDGNLYRYELRPIYSILPGDELTAAQAYVRTETDKILAQIPAKATRLETLLFLHDYIGLNFAYDTTHTVSNLYGLLQNKVGVCQAYVHLYAYLLNRLQIPNAMVTSTEMNHIWTQVELDGQWYHIDATWDDPTPDRPGRVSYTHFLLSDAGITATGHTNYTAPHPCTSTRFEDTFFGDLGSTILSTEQGYFAVGRSTRQLLRLDLETLTALPIADLSEIRWPVWDSPDSYWREQYINLYYDGTLLYFNGPDAIWAVDPHGKAPIALLTHLPTDGYLYNLTGSGHTLTCGVGKAPGEISFTVSFTTPHRFGEAVGQLFTTRTCAICGAEDHQLTPTGDAFVTPFVSTRPVAGGLHDLRLLLLLDSAQLEASEPLTVLVKLLSIDGDRTVETTLSAAAYRLFLAYEQVYSGGKTYSAANGCELVGLILENLELYSYDRISLSVTCGEQLICTAELPAELLFPPVTEPPLTDTPVSTDEAA